MSKRIAIIDDSELVLAVAEEALVEAGFAVTVHTEPPPYEDLVAIGADLLIMDVMMPDQYGDQLVRWLRLEKGARGLVFLFSALPELELASRVERSGADGYISKDWGTEELVRQVQRILAD